MKKNYNPFKSVGAWSGAVIWSILYPFINSSFFYNNAPIIYKLSWINIGALFSRIFLRETLLGKIVFIVGVPVTGFLIGYGISLLIRKLR